MLTDSAERLAAPPLRPYVAIYGGYRFEGAEPGLTRGLPSRHATLLLSLRDPFRFEQGSSFRAFVGGLSDRPALVARPPLLEGVHIKLRPLGIRSLFGLPAAALAGSVIDLRDLLGPLAAELLERLQASSTWTDRFDIIDEVLQRMLKPCPPARDLVWASGRLTAAEGSVPIAEFARELGFSRRHFSERFHSEFGLAPKTFARVLRFEHACALIKRRQGTLAQVAAAAGFSDQAHMTKEWLRLAGCTPKLWTAEELPFLQDYELAALEDVGRP